MSKIAIVDLISSSQYSQSKPHDTPKLNKEHADDYEKRTWKERLHINRDGQVVIPPMALKNCLAEAAKFLSKQIPGKGKATWTKHFEAGILVVKEMPLYTPQGKPILKDDVDEDRIFTPSDGVAGSGKRVWKTYPLIWEWTGTAQFIILDDTITEPVFAEHLEQAGNLIGLGRFRPRNRGYYGRFQAAKITWSEGLAA